MYIYVYICMYIIVLLRLVWGLLEEVDGDELVLGTTLLISC